MYFCRSLPFIITLLDVCALVFPLLLKLYFITQYVQNALLLAEVTKTENISSFNMELCKEINIVHHQVQNFCKRCKTFNLLDDKHYSFMEASVPVMTINSLLKEVNDLKETVKKLNEYQVKFSTVAGQRRLYWYVICNLCNVQ